MMYLARALGSHRSTFSAEELEVMRQAYAAAWNFRLSSQTADSRSRK